MSARFQELDRRETALGVVTLRRRREPSLGVDVFEAKLGDEFLMSSLFTAAEVELARLALAELSPAADADATLDAALDVVVGGLGLGFTAAAVLDDPRVRSLTVVEALPEVIEWHRRGLLPLSSRLTTDERCHLVQDDFFGLVAGVRRDGRRGLAPCHAVLVDIDHSPRHLLHPRHADFYTPRGLARVADLLHPGGAFALWSDDPPDSGFEASLQAVFAATASRVVTFDSHYTGERAANTVYLARVQR